MITHLLILALIIVILDRKVKITIEKDQGKGSVRARTDPPR